MEHRLTRGEKTLLRTVFGEMLPYNNIVCKVNVLQIGGDRNSITPTGNPYFSQAEYRSDFSTAPRHLKWLFMHEMTHAWQHYHRINVVLSALGLSISTGGAYGDAYGYRLRSYRGFQDFNIEQQASIIADHWIMTQGGTPRDNRAADPSLAGYDRVIREFRRGGPPVTPGYNF